ncbi:MAG TPA: response regulator [Chloroflexota bacterium]
MRRTTTILVVEDDSAIRAMLIETLRSDGYSVDGVSDTPAALEAIRSARPDLVITDYHLPGIDGLELLRSLQAEGFGDVPTLVISADARPPDLPTTSFLGKPFELDAILRAVRRALGRDIGQSDQQAESGGSWLPGFASLLGSPGVARA